MAKKQTNVPKETTKIPVVAILGHVDHGKTSLLDYIRKSRVAAKEAGGITQHIGAYQISHKGRKITFIDTPGHEAFSAMRSRGGQVSDVVLLIVAADDGVMPQTKESIAHIKAAEVPFIVVINKIDLPGANIEKIKKQLAENEVLVEGYGGDVPVVQVSAKTGQGVDDLLEMINLVVDVHEMKQKPGAFEGVVIESRLDKFKGSVATILVKTGHLQVGDSLETETVSGRIKGMTDSNGAPVKEAFASTPVEVLGFSKIPKVGETAKKMEGKSAKPDQTETQKTISIDRFAKAPEDEIRLIIKADMAGTLEAILSSLENFQGEKKKVRIYYSDTGEITEGDVLLAAAVKGLIIGFNVNISSSAERLAREEKVMVSRYSLIYELLNELKEGLDALTAEKAEEKILGEATVLQVFEIEGTKIVGAKVNSGRINKADNIVIKRGNKEVGRSAISSMKHRDSDIAEAREGDEFGLVLEKGAPFTKGDIIVAIGS